MKRLFILIISLFLIFNSALCSLAEEEPLETRMMKYELQKKDPLLGAALAIPVPSLGHYYGEDWQRGVKFIWLELLFVGTIAYNTAQKEPNFVVQNVAISALLISKLIEILDAREVVEDYNANLRKIYNIPE